MIIRLVVGDRYGDGHEKYSTEDYDINVSSLDILKEYYSKGSKALGFDLLEFCDEYEENTIESLVLLPVLLNIELALGKHDLDIEKEDENLYSFDRSSYTQFWLLIAKYGAKVSNIDLEYKSVSFADIEIGGYGLFFN